MVSQRPSQPRGARVSLLTFEENKNPASLPFSLLLVFLFFLVSLLHLVVIFLLYKAIIPLFFSDMAAPLPIFSFSRLVPSAAGIPHRYRRSPKTGNIRSAPIEFLAESDYCCHLDGLFVLIFSLFLPIFDAVCAP